MTSSPIVVAGLLLSSMLLAGCLWAEWENVPPEEVELHTEPETPTLGEPLRVTATAPVTGNLAVGIMSFEGGSKGGSGIGRTTASQTDAVREDDLITYWGGAYQRDDNGTITLLLRDAKALWTGDPERNTLILQADATFHDDAMPRLEVVVTVEGAEDPEVAWMTYAVSGSTTRSVPGPHSLQRSEDGTHHVGVWQRSMSADPETKDPWTVVFTVMAQDPVTGAIGHTTHWIVSPTGFTG